MSAVTPELELEWMELALELDQRRNPTASAKARFLRSAAIPLARYVTDEIEKMPGADALSNITLNIGGFLGSTISSENREEDGAVLAGVAVSIALAMASGKGIKPQDMITRVRSKLSLAEHELHGKKVPQCV